MCSKIRINVLSYAGCCFIKYATSEEADRAIRALHNQHTLPGVSFLTIFGFKFCCTNV